MWRATIAALVLVALTACAEDPTPQAEDRTFDFVSLHWPLEEPDPDARICQVLATGDSISLDPDPLLRLAHFDTARVAPGSDFVTVTLTDRGAEQLADVTGANIGRQLAVVVDDQVLAMPTIRDEIDSGRLDLMPMESRQEAVRLAERINRALGEMTRGR